MKKKRRSIRGSFFLIKNTYAVLLVEGGYNSGRQWKRTQEFREALGWRFAIVLLILTLNTFASLGFLRLHVASEFFVYANTIQTIMTKRSILLLLVLILFIFSLLLLLLLLLNNGHPLSLYSSTFFITIHFDHRCSDSLTRSLIDQAICSLWTEDDEGNSWRDRFSSFGGSPQKWVSKLNVTLLVVSVATFRENSF